MSGIDVSKLVGKAKPKAAAGMSRLGLVLRRIFLGISKKTQEQYYFQLSTMLSSGVPIRQALRTLAGQHKGRKARVFGTLDEEIGRGRMLSDAMSDRPEVWDALSLTMVRTGEMTGRLDENLGLMGRYLERYRRVRSKVITALLYPLLLLHLAVLIPNLLILIKGGLMPFVLTCLADLIPIYVIVAFFWLVHQLLRETKPYGEFLLSLFFFGPVVRKTALSRFSRALAALYDSGVPMAQAVEVSAEATQNGSLRERFFGVSRTVQQGVSLTEALEPVEHVPAMVKNMVSTGEHAGRLTEALRKVADYYEHEAETAVDRMARVIPVLIYLGIMGAIAWKIINFYLGYYGPFLNM